MDNIVLILSDKSQEIKRTLDVHYKESVKVIGAFKNPEEFYAEYEKHPLRVDRIILSESSFTDDPHKQLQILKGALESFYIQYKQCTFLVSDNSSTLELMEFFKEDLSRGNGENIRIFSHRSYSASIVIDYCLNKVPKKHQKEESIQYDEIVRVRRNSESTFVLEEDSDSRDKKDLVVLENNTADIRMLQEKLKNLNSLSNISQGEFWVNNKIIIDMQKAERMKHINSNLERYEIDYTQFQLSQHLTKSTSNLIIVTGEQKSGSSAMTYALAKSSSLNLKTLIIDFNPKNLGLSFIVETMSEPSTVMVLQSFERDFKNSLRTLVNSKHKLNCISMNTKTFKEINNIDILTFLTLIANSCKKYFDAVILDLPLDLVRKALPLLKTTDKFVITIPNKAINLMSTIKFINENELVDDLITEKTVVIPTSGTKEINGIPKLKKSELKSVLSNVYGKNIKCLSEVEIKSFDLDSTLYNIIKTM